MPVSGGSLHPGQQSVGKFIVVGMKSLREVVGRFKLQVFREECSDGQVPFNEF